MALEDYIPNVFGQAPVGYEGLLGADRTQALQKTANLQGLLGAASALAQGMSGQGSRRSALQNILGAVSGGFQGSQGAYQQGLQQFTQQQQLGMQQRQLAGAEQLKLKYPELAQLIDTNLPGAMRIIGDMEQEKRQPKLTSAKPGETLVDAAGNVVFRADSAPTGRVLTAQESAAFGLPANITYQQTSSGEIKAVEGTGAKATGKVLTQQESSALGLPANVVYQQTATGEIKAVEGTGAKVPEVRDFADGTTRQYDPTTASWKTIARKPAGEGATMYKKEPTVDANGRLVFLPTRAGLPILDAVTAKPVDYQAAIVSKPLPPAIQKAEDADYEVGQNAIDIATDANKYLNIIKSGAIKFGPLDRLSTSIRSAAGSDDPDVTMRNDFEAFKIRFTNESLRLNKGQQTDQDFVRALAELKSADSKAGAAKAINTLMEYNLRAAKNAQNDIIRRRKNSKLGDPEVLLDIPKFEPHVFTDADYKGLKSGTTFVDPNGVRRVKP